jgi:hypothetical protein
MRYSGSFLILEISFSKLIYIYLLITSVAQNFIYSAPNERNNRKLETSWTKTVSWLGKISVNTTEVGLPSINTQIEFHFLPLHTSVLMGPSSGTNIIVPLKLFELPNMDPYLVQHVHIIKVMPRFSCTNYNIDLIKILRVYKEFVKNRKNPSIY